MAKETVTVLDRMLLLNLLPPTGDITTLRILRKLREELSFSEEEHAAFEIRQEGEQIMWNAEKANAVEGKSVELGPKALAIIGKALERLSEQGKLQEHHIPLYERFVEATQN